MSSAAREKLPKLAALDLRPRIGGLRVKPTEVLAVFVTLLILSYVAYYYYAAVRPAKIRLEQTQKRLDDQIKTITQNQSGKTGESGVVRIGLAKDSLGSFVNRLKPLQAGRRAIFDEINGLVKKYSVELTSGIQMERGGQSEGESAKKQSHETVADLLNVYPNLQMKFAVAGSYESLRKLLNELERSQQFLVMDDVTVTTVEPVEGHRSGRRSAPTGGQSITLNVSMRAYFRPNS
ncbi:MAG TPA: GspMb/PilO family protein [Blastocatellia bacterium]|nr:GspMb/PilO family protein [Blastocatellia bacterium]